MNAKLCILHEALLRLPALQPFSSCPDSHFFWSSTSWSSAITDSVTDSSDPLKFLPVSCCSLPPWILSFLVLQSWVLMFDWTPLYSVELLSDFHSCYRLHIHANHLHVTHAAIILISFIISSNHIEKLMV